MGKANEEEARRRKLTVLDPNFWPSYMEDSYGETGDQRIMCTFYAAVGLWQHTGGILRFQRQWRKADNSAAETAHELHKYDTM